MGSIETTVVSSVCPALTRLPPKLDAAISGRCQVRFHPFPDKIALELGEAGHDRAHQLAAGRAKIEAQARLSQHAHLPRMQVIECLYKVLRAAAPAAQLRHQDGIDFACSRQSHYFAALGPVVTAISLNTPTMRWPARLA